jgi:peptidoglycan hydrolase-like protein with peptidoglycan-binding domain
MKGTKKLHKFFSFASITSMVGLTVLMMTPLPANAVKVDGKINDEEYLANDQPIITLAPGSTGEAVQDIQLFLQEREFYKGAIDGVYGASTRDAVVAFQEAEKVPVTGIVDAETLDAMDNGGLINDDPGLINPSEGIINDNGIFR